MELLQELMQVSLNAEEKLFEQHFQSLLEDLGNLKQLKIGSMINAFKQQYGSSRNSKTATGEVGNKFPKQWSRQNIGRDSEIQFGENTIKSWPAFRREFTNADKPIVGCSVNLDAKPVAVIVVNGDYFKSKNDVYGVAWDLSKVSLDDDVKKKILASLGGADVDWRSAVSKESDFKSDSQRVKFEKFYSSDKVAALAKDGKTPPSGEKKVPVKDYETWYDAMKDGGAQLEKSDDSVKASLRGKAVGEWDKKSQTGFFIQYREAFNPNVDSVYGEVKHIKGIAQTTEDIKKFIEALIANGKVTVDLVFADAELTKKRDERSQRGGPEPIVMDETAIRQAKQDLQKRLASYKASKLETVEDAAAFMKKVFEGKAKRINFAGNTYSATPAAKYLGGSGRHNKEHRSFYDQQLANLVAGKPAELQFEADRGQNQYSTLYITVKLVSGVLTPVEAKYEENGRYKTVKL